MFASLYARFGRTLANPVSKAFNIGSRDCGNLE
jgi:hypothetical protein